MPFNLIWQIPARHYWEHRWLRFLLSGLDIVEHDDTTGDGFNHVGRYGLVLPDAIVVDTGRYALDPGADRHRQLLDRRLAYFDSFRRKDYKVGLIHISDEIGEDLPIQAYDNFALVLRNYAYPQFDALAQVRILPLGCSIMSGTIPDQGQRNIAWAFMGTVWPGGPRARMLQALLDVPGGFIHTTPQFGLGTLSPPVYGGILRRTLFCPAPRGDRTWDSFRLYEGLEMGCVPMVERAEGYFRRLLGEHPMIEIDDWSEAARLARALLEDRPTLDARRQACGDWWQATKARLAREVAALVRERLGG
jgi:hypothetical protein